MRKQPINSEKEEEVIKIEDEVEPTGNEKVNEKFVGGNPLSHICIRVSHTVHLLVIFDSILTLNVKGEGAESA